MSHRQARRISSPIAAFAAFVSFGVSPSHAETAEGVPGIFAAYRDVAHIEGGLWYAAGGDLNGDGITDVVAPNISEPVISLVLSNGGEGHLTSVVQIPGEPYDADIADFDGDGVPDIVAALEDDAAFVLLIGRGGGAFDEPLVIPSPIPATDCVVGDVNNDGLIDIAAGSFIDDAVVILINEGNGAFTALEPIMLGDYVGPDGHPWAMNLADVDGDELPDLIVTSDYYLEAFVRLLINQGGGVFELQATLLSGDGWVGGDVADVNSDGHADIVVSNNREATVSILFGEGGGDFAAPITLASFEDEYARPNAVAIDDLNGDGDLDVIFTDSGLDTVNVMFGDGAGGFTPPAVSTVGLVPRAIVTGRFDDDDAADLAIASLGDRTVTILRNDGTGDFPAPQRLVSTEPPTGAALGHLNDDPYLDLVTGNGRDAFSVRMGAPGGTFMPPVDYPAFGYEKKIFLAPLNVDDDLDVVVVNELGGVTVAFNLGDGAFDAPDTYPSSPPRAYLEHDAAIADVNGDGHLDIVALTVDYSVGSYLRTYRNAGDGTFAFNFPTLINGTADGFALGEFNGDGRIDAVVALPAEYGVRLLLGVGNGTFSTHTLIDVGNSPDDVALADLDADGRLDLVVAYDDDFVSVRRGSGTGAFFTPDRYRVTDEATELAIADVNRDGLPDIVTGEAVIDVLLNLGDATFRALPAAAHGGEPVGVALGDVDGDGDLDMVKAIPAVNAVFIIPNLLCPVDLGGDGAVNGDDLFALLSAWGACASERSDTTGADDEDEPCPADINRDGMVDQGDLDMLLANWGACEGNP